MEMERLGDDPQAVIINRLFAGFYSVTLAFIFIARCCVC